MKLSIIIPLFNEELNIPELLKGVRKSLEKMNLDYEIILVNDGSTDNTRLFLDDYAQKYHQIIVINLRRNFGQTAATMAGIDQATGDILVTMDGDLQNDPNDIPLLINELNAGCDVCSGWRKKRNDPFLTRVLPSKIANKFISYISGVRLNDYGCTLKAYKKDVIKDVKLYGEMHRFIPIYASWHGAKVKEMPVNHYKRKHGKSKYGLERTFKVILDLIVIQFLSKYSQKPIYVYGGFALVNFVLGIISFGAMLYYKFWGGKTFVETPIPMLLVLFILMGFISILIGLVAEIQMRTYYESQDKTIYTVDER